MKKRTIFLIITIDAVIAGAVISYIFLKPDSFLTPDNSYKGLLIRAVSSADRIEILRPGSEAIDGGLLHEIKEPGKAKEFIEILEINENNFGNPCECGGDFQIAFFKGKTNLAKIAIKHGSFIEWLGGKWPGQTTITKDSRERVYEWLKQEGFTSYSREDELN
jgi:hypothetical protein